MDRQNAAQIPDLSSLVDDDTWGLQLTGGLQRECVLSRLHPRSGGPTGSSSSSESGRRSSTRFQQVYRRSLDEAERDWRAFCAAYRP